MTESEFLEILSNRWDRAIRKPILEVILFYQDQIIELLNKGYKTKFIGEYLEKKIDKKINERSLRSAIAKLKYQNNHFNKTLNHKPLENNRLIPKEEFETKSKEIEIYFDIEKDSIPPYILDESMDEMLDKWKKIGLTIDRVNQIIEEQTKRELTSAEKEIWMSYKRKVSAEKQSTPITDKFGHLFPKK